MLRRQNVGACGFAAALHRIHRFLALRRSYKAYRSRYHHSHRPRHIPAHNQSHFHTHSGITSSTDCPDQPTASAPAHHEPPSHQSRPLPPNRLKTMAEFLFGFFNCLTQIVVQSQYNICQNRKSSKTTDTVHLMLDSSANDATPHSLS